MFRIVILSLFFYIIYRLIKKIFTPQPNKQHHYKRKDKPEKIEGEKILPCENCKIYFPESEAIKEKGFNFCSKKCVNEYFEKRK